MKDELLKGFTLARSETVVMNYQLYEAASTSSKTAVADKNVICLSLYTKNKDYYVKCTLRSSVVLLRYDTT